MPRSKYSRNAAQLFMKHALTNQGVNVSDYKKKSFIKQLKMESIESILLMLKNIKSNIEHAQLYDDNFNFIEAINQKHLSTGMNMLDYCLAAGFKDLALELVSVGATINPKVNFFKNNVYTTFPTPNINHHPDIVKDIYEIISNCYEIKLDYEQFITKTNITMPKIVSAGQRIYHGYRTSTIFMAGIGGALLAPLLYPILHSIGATAMLISAGVGVLPAIFSRQSIDNDNIVNNAMHNHADHTDDDVPDVTNYLSIINNFVHMSHKIKNTLLVVSDDNVISIRNRNNNRVSRTDRSRVMLPRYNIKNNTESHSRTAHYDSMPYSMLINTESPSKFNHYPTAW